MTPEIAELVRRLEKIAPLQGNYADVEFLHKVAAALESLAQGREAWMEGISTGHSWLDKDLSALLHKAHGMTDQQLEDEVNCYSEDQKCLMCCAMIRAALRGEGR